MKLEDAANFLNLSGSITAEDVTKAYRKMCSKYHPDRNPAGLEMMKTINAAYEVLKGFEGTLESEVHEGWDESLNDAINMVIDLEDITVEVCGLWVWLSGEGTEKQKEIFQYNKKTNPNGFFWAKKKKMWYWRPAEYKSKNRKSWNMEKIREEHGSKKVKKGQKKAIAA